MLTLTTGAVLAAGVVWTASMVSIAGAALLVAGFGLGWVSGLGCGCGPPGVVLAAGAGSAAGVVLAAGAGSAAGVVLAAVLAAGVVLAAGMVLGACLVLGAGPAAGVV